MAPFDPILHDHEKRLKVLEASRRSLEDQMVVMAALERKHAATMEAWQDFLSERIQYDLEEKKRDDDWKAHHEVAMKEFDDKLNGLIAWLDDFVKRNPKNGK